MSKLVNPSVLTFTRMARWVAALSLSSLALTGMARADDMGDVFPPSFTVVDAQGLGVFNMSEEMDGFLAVAGTAQSAVAPATLIDSHGDAEHWYTQSVVMPVGRVTAREENGLARMSQIHLQGGMTIKKLASGASNGGQTFTLEDWRIDLGNGTIHVDIVGASGVGAVQNVHMWNFAGIEGSGLLEALSCPPAQDECIPSAVPSFTRLTGLTITQQGGDLLIASLGLRAGGRAAMGAVTDFGTLTLSAVPEPSSALLMLAGLTGVALLARQRRSQAEPAQLAVR